MRAHVYEEPPPLRDLDPHCIAGERIEAVVARCLKKEPGERFQTMSELADALRHAALAPRVAAASDLDLQVTFQRPSAPSDAPSAGDGPSRKETTPLGAGAAPVGARRPRAPARAALRPGAGALRRADAPRRRPRTR